jgi:hypothetical protein
MNCYLCFKKLRQCKYDLPYIGNVCSTCFRISKEKYIKIVDRIAERNLQYINLEIMNIQNTIRPLP